MSAPPPLRSAGLSDVGRRRTENEDRFHADPAVGVFAIIDGVGGHAGGAEAADLTLTLIRERLADGSRSAKDRLRSTLLEASNAIYALAQKRPEWQHMGCVVTAVVIEGNTVTVGHVGDTRALKLRPGSVQQITTDHSPVGEMERRGDLTEIEAMRHPDRNEVYRALGDAERADDDEGFVEITETAWEEECALLLCSDGLTDLVPLGDLISTVEANAGSPVALVQALIDAANEAGGKDNVTAVVVEGPRFAAAFRRAGEHTAAQQSRRRPSGAVGDGGPAAPVASARSRWRSVVAALALLSLGGLAGAALMFWLSGRANVPAVPDVSTAPPATEDEAVRTWTVASQGADLTTINAALNRARPGDVIIVGPGEYRERVVIRKAISLISREPRQAVIRIPEGTEGGDGVLIDHQGGRSRLTGFRVIGEKAGSFANGIAIMNAEADVDDVEVSGAYAAGIVVSGTSVAAVRGSLIHENLGAGIVVKENAQVRLAHNLLIHNGGRPANLRPAIEVGDKARVTIVGNVIGANGVSGVIGLTPAARALVFESNVLDAKVPKALVRAGPR